MTYPLTSMLRELYPDLGVRVVPSSDGLVHARAVFFGNTEPWVDYTADGDENVEALVFQLHHWEHTGKKLDPPKVVLNGKIPVPSSRQFRMEDTRLLRPLLEYERPDPVVKEIKVQKAASQPAEPKPYDPNALMFVKHLVTGKKSRMAGHQAMKLIDTGAYEKSSARGK